MPSPFPGMDPYLEDPHLWPDAHHELISVMRELLNRVLRPKYVARIEERVYMDSDEEPERHFLRVPDVNIETRTGANPSTSAALAGAVAIAEPILIHQSDPVREARIEIQELPGRSVVTVIELLSPNNKRKDSAGWKSFLEKRDEVLASSANWVEIDLLRAGTANFSKRWRGQPYPYFVYSSSPVALRPTAKGWPIRLQDPLPVVGIPLRDPDPDAPLDLQAALNLAYDRAAYDATANYAAEPNPPLPPELAEWAATRLREKNLR